MRILLTGGTGFIGPHVLARLSLGHEVFAVLRREAALPPGVTPILADLAEPLPRHRLPERIDAVVHLAQSDRYRDFPAGAPDMFRVNTASALWLADYAAAAGADRFCLVSTGTVYEPFAGPLREDVVLAPRSMLGASKLAAEDLIRAYDGLFAVATLRLFAPYGPGQAGRLVPDLIARVGSGRSVRLARDGQGLRFSPTYVADVADVIAAATLEAWSGTFNVAADRAVSLREVAELIGEILGRAPACEVCADMEPLSIVPDLGRLRARFDVSGFTALEQGLRATIREAACAG